MTAYKLFGITLGVALIGGALQAQDWSIETFLRAIETPAHDVLMEGVQQPGSRSSHLRQTGAAVVYRKHGAR